VKPIVTLTMNPSIDGSAETDVVRPIHKIRTVAERYNPGGGGVNVARVVTELQGSAKALYLAGGVTGDVLDRLLEIASIPRQRIPVRDHTRISHTVFERSSGLEYRFVPEGPQVQEAEWRECLNALREIDCDYLVASGSLPRGVPDEFYALVVDIAEKKGAKLVLDTSGAALRTTLKRGVHLVKPSLSELEMLSERKLQTPALQEAAARELVRSRAADLVALTLGREGALLVSDRGALRLAAPDVVAKSAVGAGDSFVAAMTLGLAQGRAPHDAFAYGVAAGSAAVLTTGTGLCRRDDVERLYDEVKRKTNTG